MRFEKLFSLYMLLVGPLFSANFESLHVPSPVVYSTVGLGNNGLWVFSEGRFEGTIGASIPTLSLGGTPPLYEPGPAQTLAYNGQQFVSLNSASDYGLLAYNVYTNVTYDQNGNATGTYVDHITFTVTPSSTSYVAANGGSVAIGAIVNDVLPFTFTPCNAEIPTPTAYPNPYGTSYRGINMPGFEFSPAYPPNYTEGIYYIFKGMNTVRIPFTWENIQPVLGTDITWSTPGSVPYELVALVNQLTGKGMTVFLDMHNYMRYNGIVIGSGDAGAATTPQYADVWSSIASQFLGNTNVMFDLMNEPHDMTTELILTNYNAAIAAIRTAEGMSGPYHYVLLEGNYYTCLGSWTLNTPYSANSAIFVPYPNGPGGTGIQDTANMYMINVHQYFTGGTGPNTACGSGEVDSCVTASMVLEIENYSEFTSYLQTNQFKAVLTEVGVGQSANCVECLFNFLTAVEGDAYDVHTTWGFMGWTAWASLNISTTDVLSLAPNVDGTDRPQWTGALDHFLSVPSWTPCPAP